MRDRFTFGIALIAKAHAADWNAVEALLFLTLASVAAQTDQDFRVVVAGHDRPDALADDARHRFLKVEWPAEPPDAHNSDGGRKKQRIGEEVMAAGGGLLMLLDADDWVDRNLVAQARRAISPRHVGGIVEDGLAIDIARRKALRLPHPGAFDIGFLRICGSSVVGRLDPAACEPARRDPCHVLGSHHEWPEAAARHGVPLAPIPVTGGYLVNTGENHSEHHGPHEAWRRRLSARVGALGSDLDDAALAPLGLTRAAVDRVAARLPARATSAACPARLGRTG